MTLPPILVFAKLTIWEASRRRLLAALVGLTLIVIVFSAWGFSKLGDPGLNGGQPPSELEVRTIASQLLVLVAFVFAGILALSSVVVASPSVAGEIESHQALAMLARPVSRAEYLVGKWIGLAALVVAYAVGSGTLEMVAVDIAVRYVPPQPVLLLTFVAGEGLVLLTLSLALSTRMAGMTGGIVALVLYFMAWVGGIMEGVGRGFDNQTITGIGFATRLILPTDSLWRAAVYAMEPATVIAAARSLGKLGQANPFMVTDPIQPAMVGWVVAWIAGLLALATWGFRAREV
jgi:ABC-type transport system involved in multi-copper enzyme maturation permease subunit